VNVSVAFYSNFRDLFNAATEYKYGAAAYGASLWTFIKAVFAHIHAAH
jgi:hypothetical protein